MTESICKWQSYSYFSDLLLRRTYFWIITGTGLKHPQKHLAPISVVFNAWLVHMPLRDKIHVTPQPVDLLQVIHYRAAHLLVFLLFIDTHTGLFLATLNNLTHLWTPDMPCYLQTGTLNMCRLCSPDMGRVIWKGPEKVNEGQHGVFASQDWKSSGILPDIHYWKSMFAH